MVFFPILTCLCRYTCSGGRSNYRGKQFISSAAKFILFCDSSFYLCRLASTPSSFLMEREAEQEVSGLKVGECTAQQGPQGERKPKAEPGTSYMTIFSFCTQERCGLIHVTPHKAKNFSTLREERKSPLEVQ